MVDGGVPGRGRERIKHVIVLMMENRSFDHLIGYLDHDSPDFPRLDRLDESCPVDPGRADGRRVHTSADATPALGTDPDHSHEAVMVQMFGKAGGAGEPTMSGFIESYRHKIDDGTLRAMSWWQRALTTVISFAKRVWHRILGQREATPARADDIMRCFAPAGIPVLGFLAKEFGVLVDWHASVPGETWPNRQYAHAATSHGTTNIEVGFYSDETVFERLTSAGRTWSIYVDGPAQVWAYPKLWIAGFENFHDMDRLMSDIRKGTLADYVFLEPNHGFGPGEGNSQHPGNNTVTGDSFVAGETLMARVYNALVDNPALFADTLLLITYDEHGGFFDHVPPRRVTAPDGIVGPGSDFDFTLSGVRVPAVAISPLIPAGTVDRTFYEHAAIPAMVLRQFAGGGHLTGRDRDSADPLDHLPLLAEPRADIRRAGEPAQVRAATADPRLNDFQSSLVDLAGGVHNALERPAPFAAAAEERGAPVSVPAFVPEATTRAAADAGVLPPGSEADQVVQSVTDRFVH